ncbi:MAG: helicase-exonuclease AddAB subunit AddA [Lachnospiraceae bacterium]|nr:helicase-exonuclease AddAB subunit AddA [Lachnospiraceae bacterium]
MAERRWTPEQQNAIDKRGRNLLVSAAAGSGKTAVLTERIVNMVTDPREAVDIDRLLVMTFTNAAAAEMRERVGDAIEARLEAAPGDKNLERQASLLPHAQIMTIDSFCLRLLREHFHELDIDPGFRIGDEGELLLLQADIMKELLEEYYERKDERFIRFVDAYASGKADGGLEDYILSVWRFSQSNPWPGEWIARCKRELSEETKADGTPEWLRFLLSDVKKQAEEFLEQLSKAEELAEEADGPAAYLPMLHADKEAIRKLLNADSYEQVHAVLSEPLFGRLAAARGKNVDPEKKERAAALRNRVKDAVKKMRALYAPGDLEHIFSDLEACREPVHVLLSLAEDFTARYQEAKEEKNLVDFNDLEHFALEILTGGSADHAPGPAADELAGFYKEILVDEYQDSNQVQETLLRCISRERFGEPNVFMVGDVKQSIYKFRLAKPELFLEKYEGYKPEDGPYQKIELHKNFRSRPEVLQSVNDLFFQIMTKELGNICYTDEAALYAGAAYPETETPGEAKTELLLLDAGELVSAGMEEERADYTVREAEARLIAAKIKELTDPQTGMKIWNAKEERYEPLKRRDIVILLRSLSGWSEEFLRVLAAEGIPAFAESRTGYFTAVEVETVLNLLALIDNPMQDIPLAGVLRSPVVGLSDRELAILMAGFKRDPDKGQDPGFYGAVKWFLACSWEADTVEAAIREKLLTFWELLSELRGEAEYLPVHRLLYRIFERTGYYAYVSAMPAGRARQANLDMLVEKAAAYEKTSYHSLFDFIRYIEKLKKYNTDFGEAARLGEDDDTVRIMSIHKSKGLEFPVVFLAGTAKAFNRQDSRGKILIDEELGVATDFFDMEQRLRAPTLKKNVVSRRLGLESLGEELRVLYVAMTRAREKLFITAADRYLKNRLEKWEAVSEGQVFGLGRGLPFTYLGAAGSYLDWLLMADRGLKESVKRTMVPAESLLEAEARSQAGKFELAGWLNRLQKEPWREEEEAFGGLLRKEYPYEADVFLHAKMSVSELKERGQFVDDSESDFLPTIPAFMREPGLLPPEHGGAFRGTAYHRALELLDFTKTGTRGEITAQLAAIGAAGLMDEAALGLLKPEVLLRFFRSPTAVRMKRAAEAGKLYKERQFVMGVPARELDEADSDEPVLIQGIIDAWFEEDDGAVLVDYKTDRIKEGEESVLLERYRLQMVYYARALSQITGKRVKEAVLYSLTLQKEFPVV